MIIGYLDPWGFAAKQILAGQHFAPHLNTGCGLLEPRMQGSSEPTTIVQLLRAYLNPRKTTIYGSLMSFPDRGP